MRIRSPRARSRADSSYPRRIGFAFAAAILLHVAVAALAPGSRHAEVRESVTTAVPVTIAVRTPPPTPRPSPTPTPPATPPPATPPPRATPAAHVVVEAPHAPAPPKHRAGGSAAARPPAAVASARPEPTAAAAVVANAGSGDAAGGTGTGGGAGNGDGGSAGTGSGAGSAGNGTGAADAGPCGDIFLLPGRLGYRKDGTVVQQVLAKIVDRDGTVTVEHFPYPFLYPAEKLNPFRYDSAVTTPNGGIPVQEPPPGTDVSAMSPGIQTVLRYTDPKTGFTSLPACKPDAAPPH